MLSAELKRRTTELAARHRGVTVLGRVAKVVGLLVEASGLDARTGEILEVETDGDPVLCEVVGFRDRTVVSIPFGTTRGIRPGAIVRPRNNRNEIGVGRELLGRLIDPFGLPLDGGPTPTCTNWVPVDGRPPPIVERAVVHQRFDTGVKVIDGLLTCGRGQRVGIFAGAGVGKSVLIEQIARQSFADVTVVGLIGERGREVRDLLASVKRDSMVVVAATSDRSPMERARGARVATSIAEHFRNTGANVLLVIDSLTRYAMALREIGLSIGEPPATKGYPPSVFATLPGLLERVAPMGGSGSITGFYTVLVEGDDLSDPVADSARSLLDAHIVLSRDLAARGQFPAVDVLASASRVSRQVTSQAAQNLTQTAREALSQRRLTQELVSLGAYTAGANPEFDKSLEVGRKLDTWSQQPPSLQVPYLQSMATLAAALDTQWKPDAS